MQLHRAGELNEAEIIYSRILELAPDYADALHFLGILRLYRGREDEPLRSCRDRSTQSCPGRLAQQSRERAARCAASLGIDRGLQTRGRHDPTHAPALTNLGAVLALEGRTEEAAVA